MTLPLCGTVIDWTASGSVCTFRLNVFCSSLTAEGSSQAEVSPPDKHQLWQLQTLLQSDLWMTSASIILCLMSFMCSVCLLFIHSSLFVFFPVVSFSVCLSLSSFSSIPFPFFFSSLFLHVLPSHHSPPLVSSPLPLRVTGTTLTSPLWTVFRTRCPTRCIQRSIQWWSSWFTFWSLWPSSRCITTTSLVRSSRVPMTCRGKSANTPRDRWGMEGWLWGLHVFMSTVEQCILLMHVLFKTPYFSFYTSSQMNTYLF